MSGDDTRRAVSYNVHGCRGRDGRHDIARCVDVLRALAPDVAALQEVDSRDGHDAWEAFAAGLGLKALPGPTLTAGDGRYGNLLLTRYGIVDVQHHDISVSGREPRRVIDARLAAPGGSLRVLVTHLGLTRRERFAQLRRLTDIVAARWDGAPALVMGDFNRWLRPARVGPALHRGLETPALPPTYPAGMPVLALDQIWGYPAAMLEAVWTVRTAEARLASDHLPLAARLAGEPHDGRSHGDIPATIS